MGPNDSAAFNAVAGSLGAVTGFPYAGENDLESLLSVVSQGAAGANGNTAVALATLRFALASNSGNVDVVAYSGGAEAFTEAYGELSSTDQQRIGNILYISPGAAGGIATNSTTSVVQGAGSADILATAGTTIPLGTPIAYSSCAHTDFLCLATAAQAQMKTILSDGSCSIQNSFWYDPASITGVNGGAGGGTPVPTNGSGLPAYLQRKWADYRMAVLGSLDPVPSVTTAVKYDPVK
jgi:hypothetical protein